MKPPPTGPSAEARMAPAIRDRDRPPAHTVTTRVTRTTPVPILMYHVIADPPEDAPYPELYVTPRRFAEHLAYLARHRYHVVTLQQVWNHWHGGRPLPPRPVVVSFDDGSSGWYTHAYPLLRRHGWVGTMNLALSHLNRVDLRVRWVRRLIAAGWELASHTFSHRDLTALSSRDLRREVMGSRIRLRRLFGVPVNFFCYPSGRYDATVIDAVRKAGYLGATTTVEGFAAPDGPFELKRIRIKVPTALSYFARSSLADSLIGRRQEVTETPHVSLDTNRCRTPEAGIGGVFLSRHSTATIASTMIGTLRGDGPCPGADLA